MWKSDSFSIHARRILALAFLLAASIAAQIHASNPSGKKTSESTGIKDRKSHRHCGLYCVYAIIRLAGKKVNFMELVKPEYLGSRQGSSVLELMKAAEDYGLFVAPVGNLSTRVLCNYPHPVILHVKRTMLSQTYDHYILFLGTQDGQARLLDPPNPLKVVPFHELAPCWDGNALIVSSEPIDLGSVHAPVRKRFIMYTAIVISAILALHWAKRLLPKTLLNSRIKLMCLSITQAVGFAVFALLVGMFYQFANDAGLLAHANATASIQQAHQYNFIPKISEKKVRKLLDGDTVFLDARFARDFKAGHIEGAISIPVNATDEERQKATADIPKAARIVLYCQSAGCNYAEKVAVKLIDDGFSNISIYKGGWAEWVAKNGKKKGAAS
jgi:rhodanese-related sulfurtransferase